MTQALFDLSERRHCHRCLTELTPDTIDHALGECHACNWAIAEEFLLRCARDLWRRANSTQRAELETEVRSLRDRLRGRT